MVRNGSNYINGFLIGSRVICVESPRPEIPVGTTGTVVDNAWCDLTVPVIWDNVYLRGRPKPNLWKVLPSRIKSIKSEPLGINVWVRPKAENNIVNEAVRVLACAFNLISKFFKRK